MLTRVAQDAERALEAVEQADGLLDDEQVKVAHGLLRELIGQDFDIDQDGVPRLHRGTRSDRIISTVDPEMRHGRKSSQQRFDGYKLSAAVSNASEPLILAVHVSPAGETDGPQAKHLIDSQPADQRPKRILSDTAYGNGPVRAELAERDVEVLAPVPEGTIVADIDLDADTITCPAGHTAQISTSKTGFRGANFPTAVCRDCPLKPRCCPGKARRFIRLQDHEQLLQAGRRALVDPATAEHLRRGRPRIERLLGLLAHRHGARKSRYIGSAKSRLQAAWAAALVNLNPIGHRLTNANA
jgi:Transposase DDE domain